MIHDHDQDYEVAEPAVAPDENGDAERSPSARFWRKASTAPDAASADGLTGPDRTSGSEGPEGDPTASGQTGPADERDPVDETDPADEDPFDDDVIIVAEVIDAEPASAEPASADDDSAGDDSADDEAVHRPEPIAMPTAAETTVDPENAVDPEIAGDPEDAGDPDGAGLSKAPATAYDRDVTPGPVHAAPEAGDDASEQPFDSQAWREIQASFVDDPRGAVQMAADAADSALSTLVATLRNQQASLDPAAAQDTEQLRAALQEYRKFCQAISEVGRRLPQPAASR